MSHGYTVACDMDGVVSDFSGAVGALLGLSLAPGQEIETHPEFNKKLMWRAINRFDSHTPFYYSLELKPDAMELWDFITDRFDQYDIMFLTASGHTPADAPHQKRRWVRKQFGPYDTHVVSKSHEKAAFALPNRILIDDRPKSIDPWVEAGGIGILHVSAADTIARLKEIISNPYVIVKE